MDRRISLLLPVMGLILGGCAKTESVSDASGSEAVAFDTYSARPATKGTVIGVDQLKASAGFGVFGYYTLDASYPDTNRTYKPDFMYNQKVCFSTDAGTSGKWVYSPLKFWPNNKNDKVSFFAYAPYGDSHISDISANDYAGDPTVKFTVDAAIKNQTDFLVAEGVKDQSKQEVSGKVTMKFKHALSRVGLKVEAVVDQVNGDQTGDDDTAANGTTLDGATNITVNEVQLIGTFSGAGVINLNTRKWAPDAAAQSTHTWGETDMVESVRTNVTTTVQDLTADGHYLMFLPTAQATGCRMKVKYTVTTTDSALAGSSAIVNEVTSSDFDFKFEAGKAYTFNLHIGLTSVKFDVDVEGWDAVEPGTVVNIPIN